jgi:DNA-binding TFAR19-related protein (PDSD5 family)
VNILTEEEKQKVVEMRKIEERVRTALRMCLVPKAYDRLMNVRLANQELYSSAAQYALSLYKQVGRRLTDEELVSILMNLRGRSHESKIVFK